MVWSEPARDHGPSHPLTDTEGRKQAGGVVRDGEGPTVLRGAHQQAVGVFTVENSALAVESLVTVSITSWSESVDTSTVKVTPLISKEPLETPESAATSSMT